MSAVTVIDFCRVISAFDYTLTDREKDNTINVLRIMRRQALDSGLQPVTTEQIEMFKERKDGH